MTHFRMDELAELLALVRELQGLSLAKVADRMQRCLDIRNSRHDHGDTSIGRLFAGHGIGVFEEPLDERIDLSPGDLELLADAYGVSPVVLAPLASFVTPHDTVCVVERFGDFQNSDLLAKNPSVASTYSVPRRRLWGTENVDVVHVSLPPQSRSDCHWHPGHEFLFVHRGEVDVWFHDSGLRVRLNEWDYLHFRAEKQHCIFNASHQAAEIFVVRFRPGRGQLESRNRSRPLDTPAAGGRAPSIQRWAAIHGMRSDSQEPSSLDFPDQLPAEPRSSYVLDRSGLGRLLRLFCGVDFRQGQRLSLDELAKRAEPFGLSRGKLHRLHQGQLSVTEAQLLELAIVYDTNPLFLYDFLSPTVQGLVSVRQRPGPEWHEQDSGDMREVPRSFTQTTEATYRVPCRRLSDATVSIATLDLPSAGQTPENSHPGHEILLPLEGRIRVHFGEPHVDLDASAPVFAHFHSQRSHRVVNIGDRPARLLLIRAYD